MSQKGKTESGAELLARLGPRPSLDGVEAAKVLGFEPSPGDIVELYGGEGVGKTEVLLHLVTSALLPNASADCRHGDKTEVIWVDCDLKFSVLRLAVLFEQRLVNQAMTRTQNSECGDLVCNAGAENSEHCDMVEKVSAKKSSGHGELESNRECCALSHDKLVTDKDGRTCRHTDGPNEKINLQSEKSRSTLKRKADYDDESACSKGAGRKQDMYGSNECKDISFKTSMHHAEELAADTIRDDDKCHCSLGKDEDGQETRPEDVEQRVEECLKRVHVVRCTSSQQLICTLHSMHTLIANNHNVAVLVIDPISAFFWSDRCCDFSQSSSFLYKNMANIVSILKKIASSFGILVVVTKQALVKPRQKDHASNVVSTGSVLTQRAGEDNHAEFLGQAWGGAVTHRLVCSRSVCWQRGVRITRYMFTSPAGQRHFIIDEGGIHLNQ